MALPAGGANCAPGDLPASPDADTFALGAQLLRVVHFSERDAIVPQNVISGRGVEEEIRQNVIHEIQQALHVFGAATCFPGDRFVFASIELLRFERLELGDRLLDACDEFRK